LIPTPSSPLFSFFLSLLLLPPTSTLFPYTTLFRSAAPVRVCAIKRQVQIPHYSQSLGSEGLIQLDHIHILDGQVGAFEHLPYRWHWPDTHVLRIHSSMCIGDQSSQRLQAAS